MLEGKQYERTMRAHDLLATVLKQIVFEQVSANNSNNQFIFHDLASSYAKYIDTGVNEETITAIDSDENCAIAHSEFLKATEILSASALNKLWILYIDMVDLLRKNLLVERTGKWDMYLHSLKCMLPFFAGTGHNNYTRSIYWFLQEMSELNPTVLNEFRKGFFVVRRTNTYWSGVSPNLCIEQTLMASLKGSTGLKRGKSLSDVSRLVWILSRPGVLTIDMKIKEMFGVSFRSSEQHIELKQARASRVGRNKTDMDILRSFCESRHLLQMNSMSNIDGKLRNIA